MTFAIWEWELEIGNPSSTKSQRREREKIINLEKKDLDCCLLGTRK